MGYMFELEHADGRRTRGGTYGRRLTRSESPCSVHSGLCCEDPLMDPLSPTYLR